MTNITLSEALIQKVGSAIENHKEEFYWGSRQPLGEHHKKFIKDNGLYAWENSLYDDNLDAVHSLYDQGRIEVINDHLTEIAAELNTNVDSLEVDDIKELFSDYYPEVDLNVGDLLSREKLICRVEMYSNYDCINSHWFEGSYCMQESYFGDMVNFLKLNPKKLKAVLLERGIKVTGTWRNLPHRNGKELVDYEEFAIELENSVCGANLLTFAVAFDLAELHTNNVDQIDDIKSLTLKKGTRVGLFSSFNGGGSMFDMELLNDTELKMGQWGKTKYDSIDISTSGYSIDDVYGVTDNFFEEIIKFKYDQAA